jgi:hypothetical protein
MQLDNFVKLWAAELDINKKCPYAKAAYDRNKIKTVMLTCSTSYDFWSSVYKEADEFDDTNDVVMIAIKTDPEVITSMQMSGGCDSFNGSCNNKNIDLWALNLYEELYTIVLLQRLTKLDNASKVFESKDYYNDYIPYMYNKFILTRRTIREQLEEHK